jgi:hypothetical protein
MNTETDFIERFKEYARTHRIDGASYEICDADGNSLGWIARASVMRPGIESDKGHLVRQADNGPPNPKTYPSEREANDAALWLGLRWLEEGRAA